MDTPKTAEIIGGKLFQSPLEKYLEKQRDSIRNVKEKEKCVMGTLQEYQSAIKKKVGYVDGPMCGVREFEQDNEVRRHT